MLPVFALAQSKLIIYHTTGNVTILSGSISKPAVRSDILTMSNSLKLQEPASCMLINATGKSLQLTTTGTYSFDKLEKLLAIAGVSNVSAKFFKYVYDNLFTGQQKDKMDITPVVFRGTSLMEAPENNQLIFTAGITFKWRKPDDGNAVRISIRSGKTIVLDTVFKHANSYTLIVSKLLVQGVKYEWIAREEGTKQQTDSWYEFLIPFKRDITKMDSELKNIMQKSLSTETKKLLRKDLFEMWLFKDTYLNQNAIPGTLY